MSLPWSSKGSKATPVGADETLIIDSQDANPSTENKLIRLDSLSNIPWTTNVDAGGFDLLNVGGIQINNPADTFQYVITPGAIIADRILNIPLMTGNDTIVLESFASTLINKTIAAGSNTITGITNTNLTSGVFSAITGIGTQSQTLNMNSNFITNAILNNTDEFDDNGLIIQNPADTFNYIFQSSAIIADRTITLPLLTGNDALVLNDFTATLTNKTMTAGANTFSGFAIGAEVTGASTDLTDTAVIVRTDQTNTFGDFAQIIPDNQLFIQNPAATFEYQIIAAAIVADRILNLPLMTGTDTVVLNDFAATLTNKTLGATNTVNSSLTWNEFRQTFNPNATIAGINVGSHTANPSVPVDGDVWYNSTSGQIFGRANGTNVDLGAASGGSPPFADSTSIVEGSVDPTKEIRFEVDGLTTATTRVITAPDVDITLVSTSDGLITNANVDAAAAIVTSKLADAANFVLINQANTYGDFAQTFADNQLFIQNPAATFEFQISAPGIAADRTLTLPLLTGNDIMVTEAFIQTLTNKTITAAANTLTIASTDLTDTAVIVLENQANTYTAGTKQSFLADATTAGININNQIPSITVGGDIWRATDALTYRNNADTLDLILATTTDISTKFDTAGTGLTSAGTTVNAIGTASRISVSADAIDIDVAYVGQATITTLGTIATGIWEGTPVASAFLDADTMHLSVIQTITGAKTFGGVADVGKLIIAGTTSGTTVLDATAVASGVLSLPAATDILVGKATTDIFTNKSYDLGGTGNVLTGTTAQFNTALSDNDFATLAGTETLSGKTLTEPRFADLGFIADANGAEMLSFDTVASAANFAQLANSATTLAPSLSALGSDTNIDFRFIPKGTGTFFGVRETWAWPLTDETTAPSTGVKFTSEPAPYDMAIEDAIAGLTTAGTGAALFTLDILKETGVNTNVFTTIFSTKPTIDASEFTSTTAVTAPVISVSTWEKGRRLQLSIDTLDTNGLARGAKIELLVHATAK